MENDVDQQQQEWRRDERYAGFSGGVAHDTIPSGADAAAIGNDACDGIDDTDGVGGANGASSCDAGSEYDGDIDRDALNLMKSDA